MKLPLLLPPWFKNKYFLSLFLFGVWMMFFDHNDFFLQAKRNAELKDLQMRKAYYQEQIDQTRNALNEIQANAGSLEKIAREKYLMKKDNEDLYVLPEPK